MRMIFENLLALLDRGEDAVLVTVVLAQGSTPRGAGSQLLAGREGLMAGTIGGGPGEAQALAFAAELLREGRSAVRRLELRHGGELDSVCGGEQTVLFLTTEPFYHPICLYSLSARMTDRSHHA